MLMMKICVTVLQPSEPGDSTAQYVGSRSLRSLIQFVVSQASVELDTWDWRGERRNQEEMAGDEEGEVEEHQEL